MSGLLLEKEPHLQGGRKEGFPGAAQCGLCAARPLEPGLRVPAKRHKEEGTETFPAVLPP